MGRLCVSLRIKTWKEYGIIRGTDLMFVLRILIDLNRRITTEQRFWLCTPYMVLVMLLGPCLTG